MRGGKNFRAMHIEIDRLDEEGAAFTHIYAPDELALEDERAQLSGAMHVAGHAAKKRDQVRVTGKLEGAVKVQCDRCLHPVASPLQTEFDVAYAPAFVLDEAEADEVKELHDEDLILAFYEGDQLDVDELVREQVLLALPMRLLCREDCKGLCLACGADLNRDLCACAQPEVDPRWSALAALKRDGNGQA